MRSLRNPEYYLHRDPEYEMDPLKRQRFQKEFVRHVPSDSYHETEEAPIEYPIEIYESKKHFSSVEQSHKPVQDQDVLIAHPTPQILHMPQQPSEVNFGELYNPEIDSIMLEHTMNTLEEELDKTELEDAINQSAKLFEEQSLEDMLANQTYDEIPDINEMPQESQLNELEQEIQDEIEKLLDNPFFMEF